MRHALLTLTNIDHTLRPAGHCRHFFQHQRAHSHHPGHGRASARDQCGRHHRRIELPILSPIRTIGPSLPNFNSLTPVLSGAVSFADVSPRQQRVNYGFNYYRIISTPRPRYCIPSPSIRATAAVDHRRHHGHQVRRLARFHRIHERRHRARGGTASVQSAILQRARPIP